MKDVDTARLEALLCARARLEACAPPKTAPRTAPPVLFDFGGGRPDPASFPLADMVRATERALAAEGKEAMTYGPITGYDGLRDLVCDKLKRHESLDVRRDEIFITNGSSQALGVIADAFVDIGDVVITESPTFSGTLGMLRKRGAVAYGVPLDGAGMRTDELEALLKRLAAEGKRPKLIYTMDNFHNPAGPSMSLARRHELLRLADEYGVLVVEDDAYGELRFEGEPIPSLYALDGSGLAIRTGTLSKVLGAGVRLGWVIAAPGVIERLLPLKQDWGTSPFMSRVATYYLREHLDEHIRELVGVYRAKRDAMLRALEQGLGDTAIWSRPEGGFFVWVRLPEGTDPKKLYALAAERQVACVGGAGFFPEGGGNEFMRLAYSYASVAEITEGVGRLCEAIGLAR